MNRLGIRTGRGVLKGIVLASIAALAVEYLVLPFVGIGSMIGSMTGSDPLSNELIIVFVSFLISFGVAYRMRGRRRGPLRT